MSTPIFIFKMFTLYNTDVTLIEVSSMTVIAIWAISWNYLTLRIRRHLPWNNNALETINGSRVFTPGTALRFRSFFPPCISYGTDRGVSLREREFSLFLDLWKQNNYRWNGQRSFFLVFVKGCNSYWVIISKTFVLEPVSSFLHRRVDD